MRRIDTAVRNNVTAIISVLLLCETHELKYRHVINHVFLQLLLLSKCVVVQPLDASCHRPLGTLLHRFCMVKVNAPAYNRGSAVRAVERLKCANSFVA